MESKYSVLNTDEDTPLNVRSGFPTFYRVQSIWIAVISTAIISSIITWTVFSTAIGLLDNTSKRASLKAQYINSTCGRSVDEVLVRHDGRLLTAT